MVTALQAFRVIKYSSSQTRQVFPPTISQQDPSETVDRLKTAIKQLREEYEQVKAERDTLKEEKRQNLQDRRQKRIEEWRFVIRNFDFETDSFASTDTYSQMKLYLRPEVIEMFEMPRTLHVGNDARVDPPYRSKSLDEVARIEWEWGLI